MAKKKSEEVQRKTVTELFLEERERELRSLYMIVDGTALTKVAVGPNEKYRLEEFNSKERWDGHTIIMKDRTVFTAYETAQQAVYAKVQENNAEIWRLNKSNEYVMEHLKHN